MSVKKNPEVLRNTRGRKKCSKSTLEQFKIWIWICFLFFIIHSSWIWQVSWPVWFNINLKLNNFDFLLDYLYPFPSFFSWKQSNELIQMLTACLCLGTQCRAILFEVFPACFRCLSHGSLWSQLRKPAVVREQEVGSLMMS